MFDIDGSHITQLTDSDLRTLVALLCEAELHRRGYPISAVTAGGDQDAPDGGLDVCVELPASMSISGFIPCPMTGFQVKKSDMPRGKILKEMCPGGTLRQAIRDLAEVSGAYIIVSAHESTTNSVLGQRRKAMREAVQSLPNSSVLHLDFYDRTRLASWVREHKGLVAWVREKIGDPIRGWRPYESWAAPSESVDAEYLLDKTTRLYDWQSQQDGPLPIEEGIQRIRKVLAQHKGVVRLIGLSGIGKTRLVQALFDGRVGDHALDRTLVVYTDLADQPEPSPRDLVRRVIQERRCAIVVVDNCPPDTHRALAATCTAQESLVSLITVEYDVGDDDPEGTEVFRLEPASNEVMERLLERRMPQISQVDRRRIAEFSGGNARIALTQAHTIRHGESVANLTDQELFERLFHQRQTRDDNLMRAAEVCSLVYSFNGEALEGAEAELPLLAELAGMTVEQIYRHVAELRSRGLVQCRGQWRAVLPPALANRLARQALERTPQDRIVSAFLNRGSERLLRSFSRRLGYLHDCESAQKIVLGWLSVGGMLFDITQLNSLGVVMFRNVAPVAPSAVLDAIEFTANGTQGSDFLSISNQQRNTWIALLKLIAYDRNLFSRAALLLARFLMVEPPGYNTDSARHLFTSLFQLRLSGTHASISERLHIVETLLASTEQANQACGLDALDELLRSGSFFSGSGFEFGTRPRDFGWNPTSVSDIVTWYQAVIECGQHFALSEGPLSKKARNILASNFRGLWVNVGIFDKLEAMMCAIARYGFWSEGWIAVRNTIQFDAEHMAPPLVDRLRALEEKLRPNGRLQMARAYVFSTAGGALNVADGEPVEADVHAVKAYERADEITESLGYEIATDVETLRALLPDLVHGDVPRGWSFGRGLALGAFDLSDMWQYLVNALGATPEGQRNIQVLRGFLHAASARDPETTACFLNAAVADPILGPWFPALQVSVHIGEPGARRLETALQLSLAPSWIYRNLSLGRATESIPSENLGRLVLAIASLQDGYKVAVEVLQARLHSASEPLDAELIYCGRELIRRCTFEKPDWSLDYPLSQITHACFSSPDAAEDIHDVCRRIKQAVLDRRLYSLDDSRLVTSIFSMHPLIALDEFVDDLSLELRGSLVGDIELNRKNCLDAVPMETLCAWAQTNPSIRFPRLASAILPFFTEGSGRELVWTPLALQILNLAPDRLAVLNEFDAHLSSGGWGSLADILDSRRSLPQALLSHDDPNVVAWARTQDAQLCHMMAQERERERRGDESFE